MIIIPFFIDLNVPKMAVDYAFPHLHKGILKKTAGNNYGDAAECYGAKGNQASDFISEDCSSNSNSTCIDTYQ